MNFGFESQTLETPTHVQENFEFDKKTQNVYSF